MKSLFYALTLLCIISCYSKDGPSIDVGQVKIELDSIMKLDQKYRSQLPDLFKKYGPDAKEFKDILKKQNEIDSSNLIYVKDLIEAYGKYPGSSLVGNEVGDVAFFVLQHAPDSIHAKYLPVIMAAVENGELQRNYGAMYKDRYLLGLGKPQIFGSQVVSHQWIDPDTETPNLLVLWPIKDTTDIDSLRLWNGLRPLEDYLNSFGISRWDTTTPTIKDFNLE